MKQKSVLEPQSPQLILITRAILLGLIIQFLMSWDLWTSNREFPTVSIFNFLEFNFPIPLVSFLAIAVLGTACILFFYPFKKIPQVGFFILLAILIMLDINRLQVWLYQLCICLAVIFYFDAQKKSWTSLIFLIGMTYFWSGFFKLNLYFIEKEFPELIEGFPSLNFLSNYKVVPIMVAIIEMLSGLALLFFKSRKVACVVLIGLHLSILLFLGPFGSQWNAIVWPWNLTMIFILMIFVKTPQSILRNKIPVLLIFLFGLLPFLNLFGKWPENLSFKMYAGTHPEAIFYFNSKDKNCFPAQLENNFIPIQVDINQYQYNLLLDDWSFKTRSVPLFAHLYNYKEIGKKLCHCLENPELGGLKVFTVHPWDKSKESFTEIPCNQLFSNTH